MFSDLLHEISLPSLWQSGCVVLHLSAHICDQFGIIAEVKRNVHTKFASYLNEPGTC